MARQGPLWFTPAIRRAYPFIRKGVNSGLTGGEIIRSLQAGGMGVRRQDLTNAIAFENTRFEAGSQLRFLRRDRHFNPNRLPTAVTKIRGAFSLTVRVRGVDSNTGKSLERFVTVSSNSILTRQQVEDKAEQAISFDKDRYEFNVTETLIISGQRSGVLGLI